MGKALKDICFMLWMVLAAGCEICNIE